MHLFQIFIDFVILVMKKIKTMHKLYFYFSDKLSLKSRFDIKKFKEVIFQTFKSNKKWG